MRVRNEQVVAERQRRARWYRPTRFIGIGLVAMLVSVAPAYAGPQTPVSDADPISDGQARGGSGGSVPQRRATDVHKNPASGESIPNHEIEEDCE